MAVKINTKYLSDFASDDEIGSIMPEVIAADRTLRDGTGKGADFRGWLALPDNYDREEYSRIKAAAEKIKKNCDVFVVIGIGGSYLGARAAIEFVKSPLYNNLKKDTPDIYFAGNGINSAYLNELISICEGRDVCINVISKSGKTTEPAIAFRIFREMLEKKYGEEGARDRIFITTDRKKGKLKELADEKGYETFVVPDDIGGRYSVLTAVGLLPIAVAGIDTDAMMNGAKKAMDYFATVSPEANDAFIYAACRNILYRKGKKTEIMVSYDPALAMMNEWWKQLYGESEGKDGKGLFPASVIFSTDLHSLGQYIQQGERTMFETVINILGDESPFVIPDDPNNIDEMNFISGKTLHFVNRNAFLATVISHSDGNVPNLILDLDGRSAEDFGYLVYFFELACAVSGYTLGVNPFDQPGVEGYKNNMYALLGKPGEEHEKRRSELKNRIY
ncbi:MAG: glucose-6-phosphate isomerase [Firmicutes bacterium]|nr:glucose-6-phosphate isomerase [Candidatus Colimorpha enterica]